VTDKFAAFGWHVQRVDGNDIEAVRAAFDTAMALSDDRPRAIVFDTKMGTGVPFLESREVTHFIRVEADEWALALEALERGRPA
jgi:transketolase